MMSDEELAAIRAREAAATPGPWEAVYDGDWQVEEVYDHGGMINPPQIAYQAQDYHENTPANMRFMAHARTDIPTLLAAHDALVAENARLRAGIEGLRLEHATHTVWADDGDGYRDEMQEPCPAERGLVPGPCECGAAEHNAAIDALLKGDT